MALLQIKNFAELKQAHREWIEEALKKTKIGCGVLLLHNYRPK